MVVDFWNFILTKFSLRIAHPLVYPTLRRRKSPDFASKNATDT